MTFNRFDMEQQILACWQICEALNDITEGTLEYDWGPDKVSNVTIGLKEQFDLRFDKLFQMFEDGIRQGYIK